MSQFAEQSAVTGLRFDLRNSDETSVGFRSHGTTRSQEQKAFAERLAAKTASGLVDIRFDLRNTDEASTESVTREVNRLYDAVACGNAEPLIFKNL